MQIKLRKNLSDLLRPAFKHWQYPTLKTLLKTPHTRAPHCYRACLQRNPPGLAITVTPALRCIYSLAPLMPGSAQKTLNFLFQYTLHELLDLQPTPSLLSAVKSNPATSGRFKTSQFQFRVA